MISPEVVVETGIGKMAGTRCILYKTNHDKYYRVTYDNVPVQITENTYRNALLKNIGVTPDK